jgi:signal transduction histidine kinase/ActR/RegA family two-component response regulator
LVRASCGCGDFPANVGRDTVQTYVELRRDDIVAFAADRAARQLDDVDERRVLLSLVREFSGQTGAVVREVDAILELAETNEVYQSLQLLLLRLRRQFAHFAAPQLDDLWHQASVHVALMNTRQQEQLRLDNDQAYYRWIDIGECFGAALDIATLANSLAGALQSIGITHGYVSYYPERDARELECLVALRDGRVVELDGLRFSAELLAPPGAFERAQRGTFLAFPLAYHARNLGVAIFELSRTVGGYPIIRDQISAVLQSITLHQEALRQTTLHERRIQEQERAATMARIQSLSVLAGGVAHDLNNVLGPLVALPDVMLSQLSQLTGTGEAVDALKADLDIIKLAALRATQTIKDLLTLGRQGHVAKEPLELNAAVVRSVALERQRGSAGSGCAIDLELCSVPLWIMASEAHISRVVMNLIRNAFEAIGSQGSVKVTSAAMSLASALSGFEIVPPGDYAVLAVTDTGRGIAEVDISRLFEPFFSKKRPSEHSGSGLGLAIVHGVVKEHHGFVNVESVLGRGTTFTLYFPITEALGLRIRSASEVPRGDAKILVVDDEIIQLRTCRRVLSQLGYRVDTLSSGREALELLRHASSYDLLILDLQLNEEDDGLEVLQKIRSTHPDQRAIIASGHAPNYVLEQAEEQGVTWLAKPYTQSTLARAVRRALEAVRRP